MAEPIASFAQLLLTYRHRLGLSQQEVATMAGIYASDLSKMERGKKEPPRTQVVLRLVDGLRLSHTEAREFVTAAGYSVAILEQAKFDPSMYPPVAVETVKEKLQGSHGRWPVSELDTDRKIIAANLLAFRLWGALEETTQEIKPNRLLGENIYAVLGRPENFSRIGMPAKEDDFWYTFLAVWNKLKDTVPRSTVIAFEKVIEAQPLLKLVLRYGVVNVEREWIYNLDILPPGASPLADQPEPHLKFQVEVERIMNGEEHKGYLVSCRPVKSFTQEWVDREYIRLIATYGKEAFVQRELDTHLIEEEEKYPSFFPAFHHDELWKINFENRQFIALFDEGEEFLDKHYFEMLLSLHIIELMGGLDKQELVILVRRFLQQTKDYDNDEQYTHIKARLLDLPAFQTLLTGLWLTPSETPSQSVKEIPCFSIEVVCPFTNTLKLSFDIVARQPYANEADYRITFVPTTTTTKAALILLRLHKNGDVLSSIGTTEYEQLLWLLATLKTVREGLTKKKGKADWGWHPERAFKKLHSTLTAATEQGAVTTLETMKLQVTWTLAQLLLEDEHRQEGLLATLNSFVGRLGAQACYAHEFLLKALSHAREQ